MTPEPQAPPVLPHGVADEPDVLDTGAAGPAAMRGGAIRVIGYVGGVVLSVGSAALLFRHLGVVDAGRYVTVISLIGIAQGLTDVGISALGVREMAVRDAEGRRLLMRALLGLRFVMTVIGVAGAVAFAAIAGYGPALVLGTLLAGIGLLVQNAQGTFAIALISRLRFGWVTVAELCRQVVTVAAIVGLVAFGASLVPFFAVAIVAGLASLAVTIPLVRRDVPLLPSFHRAEWSHLVRATLPFVVATAVYGVYFRVAVILVSLIASDEQLGFYGAAFRIVEVLVLIPSLAVSAVFPIFARAARDDFERLVAGVQRTFETGLLAGAGAGLALALGAPFAIRVVAGPGFEPAVPVLRIEAIALVAAFVTQTFGFALLSLHRHRALLVINLVGLALTGGLTGVLAHTDGARGAAIAVAAGEAGLATAALVAYLRHTPRPALHLGIVPRLALAVAVAIAVAVVIGGPALVSTIIGVAVYGLAALALRAVPAELLHLLPSRRAGAE
jgi:O-antigen/teichoic acid export membrane protein